MTPSTLTIRPLTGHSKGCDRQAFVTIDGAPCMAGTMRAADVDSYTADHEAINGADVIVLTESPLYAGCFSAAYDGAVKVDHREGAYLAGRQIGYYTAEAQQASRPQIVIADGGAAVTSHYEAPKARRVLRDGETLALCLVARDGSTVDIQTTISIRGGRVAAPIAGVE